VVDGQPIFGQETMALPLMQVYVFNLVAKTILLG